MGVCESENNTKETNIPSGSQAKSPIKKERMIDGHPIIEIDPCVANPLKALCFIQTQSTSGTGFFIRLFKGTQDFFCLITCEHVITREMVNQYADTFHYEEMDIVDQAIFLL